MSNAKLRRVLFLFLVVELCLIPGVQIAQESETTITARQKVDAARDKSDSIEERHAALEVLKDATQLFIKSGKPVDAAITLNRIGRLQLDLNQPKEAIESHKKALGLLKQAQSNEAEIDNLNGLAGAYMHISELVLAETALRRAIEISQQISSLAREAEALLTLSDRQNFENHLVALETAQKALSLSESIGDNSGIAKAHSQIGQYYMALQRLAESKQSYEKAYSLFHDLGDVRRQADALIALGFVEYRKGNWEDCISILTQAQSLLGPQADPLRLGQIAVGMAESFNSSGLPEIGLGNFQRGLEYYRQAQKPDFVSDVIWAIGRSHYFLGNYREAIKQLELALSSVPVNSILAAQCHEFMARVFLAMSDPDIARKHLEVALPIYEHAVNPKEIAQVRGLMGQVYSQLGDKERARQYYQQALDGFTRLADRVNLAVIYFAIGRLELSEGNLNSAQTHLRQSIEVTEDMRRVSTSSDLTASFSATVHERYESYIECLMRMHKAQPNKGFDVRAFETSELSRGRALVELLQATQTSEAPGLDPQLAGQEKSLRQLLRVKENSKVSLLTKTYKKEELDAIESEIATLDAQYKQVLESIRANYPSFEQINRPTGWDVRQIQEKVVADDETLLLEYSLGADRSYVWMVTRDRITSYELPSETLINQAAQKVYQLLATSPGSEPSNELDQATQELSQMILSPVVADLNKRRVIIVADGALNYIPFQFLPAPSGDRQQLVVAHEVINGPSASILGQLRQETMRRQPATNVLAAFGDPVFASNYALQKNTSNGEQLAYVKTPEDDRMRAALRDIELNGDSFDPSVIQPLFYAKQELANLREVAGDNTLLATGFDATLENLQHTDLTKYAALHFATHGVLDPKRPENSGLILSTVDRNGNTKNGFVSLSNIYNLHAPVDLVVLSACRTGLGKDVRGEGLIGITRGFMYAGASSVVASLWKVDDEATAELMKQFYTNLLENGMTPAAALGAAQNSIRQQKRWRSPYFWAAFTIQGDSRTVIKATRASTRNSYENIVALGLLFVLMGIVGWSYRRHVRGMTK